MKIIEDIFASAFNMYMYISKEKSLAQGPINIV